MIRSPARTWSCTIASSCPIQMSSNCRASATIRRWKRQMRCFKPFSNFITPLKPPMDTQTSEVELFRDNVVRFFADNVEPHYDKWEKDGILPMDLYRQMGEAGLLCVDTPEQYGGTGAPFVFSTVVVEEAGRMGFLALASNLTVHSD